MGTAAEVLELLRPLSVKEFHRLVEAGILGPDERIELIDGVLVKMVALHPPRAALTSRVVRVLFVLETRRKALVRRETAVVLGPYSELYPDISVVRFREDDYATAHPAAADTLLVVEVADSTLHADRRVKVPKYARAKVPEVWLANLPQRQLEVHRDPARGRYRAVSIVAADSGGTVAPAAFPDLEVDVGALFRWI